MQRPSDNHFGGFNRTYQTILNANKLDGIAVISMNKSCNHKMINSSVVMVGRLGALLYILSVAPLLEGLPRHVLLDVLTLLSGDGGALLASGTGAFLLIHVLGDGSGDITANLVRNIIADLTRSGHIFTNLGEKFDEEGKNKIVDDRMLPA